MKNFRFLSFIVLLSFICNLRYLQAQEEKGLQYTNAKLLTLIGKALKGENFFHRIDTSAFQNIPAPVKYFLTHSTGLAIGFITNSTNISAQWCTSPRRPTSNNTGIASEGLDLYIKKEGKWQYAGVGRPDKIDCNEYSLVTNMDKEMKECLLYLPLFDELTSLIIGTDSNACINPLPNPFKHNILVYGSSIVHGAAASRPGLAYPAKLSRETGFNFINFGFAGNAKMEKTVADMIALLPVDAFILDCVPNPTPDEIAERTATFIKTIRAMHPGKPIIAIQSVIRESGNFNRVVAVQVKDQNENFSREIKEMQKHDEHLYLIPAEGLLGDDHEGTIDGTHPNDLGFDRMVKKLRPTVMNILKKYNID